MVLRRLILEDACFRGHIILHIAVAIEVVGRDVEDDGDIGMKVDDGFQLKAGDLKHIPGLRRALRDQRNHRQSNVAADLGRLAAGAKYFSAKCGGGCLAVRSGDGENVALQKT